MKNIKNIYNKIKLCLEKDRSEYHVHEPINLDRSRNNLLKCIKSGFVSTRGDFIDKFSTEIKKITKSKYVLLTNTGTSSLFISLYQLKINDTEVLVPSMTFAATCNSIKYLGGYPHFIDCEENYPNIDSHKLEEYLNKNCILKNGRCINKKTKKVISTLIVVHAFGYPADVLSIKKICNKYNIAIIEDAAGGLGSYLNNQHLGTFTRIGILSFNGNKIVTSGMGGALLIKYKKDFNFLSHLIGTARKLHPWRIDHNMVGYNLKMANINASLGYSQIIHLNSILMKKRRLHKLYSSTLDDHNCKIMNSSASKPNYWINNLILEKKYKDDKIPLIEKLHRDKIFVREIWKPQHLLSMHRTCPHMNMENTVDLWKRTISLPSSYLKNV